MPAKSRILAVDDYEAHAYVLQKMLEAEGFDVAVANSALAAKTKALEFQPHVILMDVNLPDGNGIDVCRSLKAESATAKIAVIFHTATSANSSSRLRAEEAGGVGFLSYPIAKEHLLTVIKGTMARVAAGNERE